MNRPAPFDYCENCTPWPCLLFEVQTIKFVRKSARFRLQPWLVRVSVCMCVCICLFVCYNRWHRSHLSENQKCKNDICTFWHLPSNGFITKIVFCDLDLHLKAKNLNLDLPAMVSNHSGATCVSKDSNQDFPTIASNHSGATYRSKDSNRDLSTVMNVYSCLKCKWQLYCSQRFASTCMAPAIELLLFHSGRGM